MEKTRDYVYYDFTLSLCSKWLNGGEQQCLRTIPTKIAFQDDKVFMLKHCNEHGNEKVLIGTDVDYYRQIRNYMKKSEMPKKFNTPVKFGCPYDCGLCTDHEQHSCLTLVEITDRCNLSCPTCYAMSSPTYGRHRTLDEVINMLDIIVRNEGEPDVVQISGGEPTVHPEFFKILDEAKKRPIKHLMVNTNGIKIASEEGFAERLADYMPDFELYLQFDSFKSEALKSLRGADLTGVREKAIEKLNRLNLSTTLVSTLQKGVNTDEIGKLIEYGLKQRCVRGVTFQPTQIAGRVENFNPETDRYTLTEVRQAILDQTDIFKPNDLIPVPCNPDALVMGYALKLNGKVHPLTRYVDPEKLLNSSKDTIMYESDRGLIGKVLKPFKFFSERECGEEISFFAKLKEKAFGLFSTAHSPESASKHLYSLLCCLPKIQAPSDLTYENIFRVIVMRFIDAYDFDVRAIKKSCVHIVHKDGRIIPFETMNLFYRDEKEKYSKELQREVKW